MHYLLSEFILVADGYRTVVIDTRGHGRSTRDARPYTYELLASDVAAVMDALQLAQAGLVGWSDGACTALVLATHAPARVAGVFFFGCNMDPSGTKEFVFTPTLGRCLNRHKRDYAQLSATPDDFDDFAEAVGLMQRTQPNYSWQTMPDRSQMYVTNPFKYGRASALKVVRVHTLGPHQPVIPICWYGVGKQAWSHAPLPTRGQYLLRHGGASNFRRIYAILELSYPYFATIQHHPVRAPVSELY